MLVPAGLAGMLLALLGGIPAVVGVAVGGLTSWVTVLVLDFRRWARFESQIPVNHELPKLQALTARLCSEGLKVRIEPAHALDEAQYRLITERRWVDRVRTSLEDLDGQQT